MGSGGEHDGQGGAMANGFWDERYAGEDFHFGTGPA